MSRAGEKAARTDAATASLRRHLAQPGAFGCLSPLGCGRLALYRSKGGTSLGAGYAPIEAAEALVASGGAQWTGEGRTRRLLPRDPVGRVTRSVVEATVMVDGRAQSVMLDERESPLLWLHRRPGKDGQPQISAQEFAAGERFRADLTLARMMPRMTMNWDASLAPDGRGAGSRGSASASDAALAARQRVRLACDRLGPDLSGLAIDVCGFLKGLDSVERERGWPARSAKVVLRLALKSLATHYGLVTPPASRRRDQVWLADDARATIMAASAG
ncbi:DUF6456 domain-containing protein [Bosea sp. (in: a-proteobacteria)]|uniref:DUF6456 domain-containing protein n=1 Tax=Bosea sp. (in: a-proteobacteria) TaxID=1871050 RepID=UPI002734131E|nr:DUF6456 domain-containing protein [Bosea sp. (in: a-proteobacteria)]MDP3408953.1 DUF6456 domain-containing protein [Bosea sp. (in: a-proteobacteria)]